MGVPGTSSWGSTSQLVVFPVQAVAGPAAKGAKATVTEDPLPSVGSVGHANGSVAEIWRFHHQQMVIS